MNRVGPGGQPGSESLLQRGRLNPEHRHFGDSHSRTRQHATTRTRPRRRAHHGRAETTATKPLTNKEESFGARRTAPDRGFGCSPLRATPQRAPGKRSLRSEANRNGGRALLRPDHLGPHTLRINSATRASDPPSGQSERLHGLRVRSAGVKQGCGWKVPGEACGVAVPIQGVKWRSIFSKPR